MSEPPIETERLTRRWMRKENLNFNSRCCSPQGSGNLKSLSNYFGLSMMSSSGPHKIAGLVGSLHLAITGHWLPHTTRPSFQSRILKAGNLAPVCYLYLWHRNSICGSKEFVCPTSSFIVSTLPGVWLVLLILTRSLYSSQTSAVNVAQHHSKSWVKGKFKVYNIPAYNNHADMNSLQNRHVGRPCHIRKVNWFLNWVFSKE